jgi:hypothetical protein
MTQTGRSGLEYPFTAKYERSNGSIIGHHYIPKYHCTWALELKEVESNSITYTAFLVDGSSFGCSSKTPFELKYINAKHIYLTFHMQNGTKGEGTLTRRP